MVSKGATFAAGALFAAPSSVIQARRAALTAQAALQSSTQSAIQARRGAFVATSLFAAAGDVTWVAAPADPLFDELAGPQTHDLVQYTTGFDSTKHRFAVAPVSPDPPEGVSLNTAAGYAYDGVAPAASVSGMIIDIEDIPIGDLPPMPSVPANARSLSDPEFSIFPSETLDQRTALQAALNALAPGDWLVFPPGTYLHSGSLQMNVPNTTLWGDGALLRSTNPTDSALSINADGGSIYKLRRQAVTVSRENGSNDASLSIMASIGGPRRAGCTIRGCIIENGGAPGTSLANGSAGAGIYVHYADNFLIAENIVKRTLADAIHMTQGSQNGKVIENRVYESGDDMISCVSYLMSGLGTYSATYANTNLSVLRADRMVRKILIRRNTCDNQYWGRGITVVGGEDITIEDNTVLHPCHASGILVARENANHTFGVNNVLVRRNTVRYSQTEAPTYDITPPKWARTGMAGIEVNCLNDAAEVALSPLYAALTVQNVMFEDNIIDETYYDGFRVNPRGSVDSKIGKIGFVDNTLTTIAGAGINILVTPTVDFNIYCPGNTDDGATISNPLCSGVAPTVTGEGSWTPPPPPPPAPVEYATTFAGVENPLSEGGRWINGGTYGWRNLRKEFDRAFGVETLPSGQLDECVAILGNAGLDPALPHYVEGKFYLSGANTVTTQVKLCCFFNLSASGAQGYAFQFLRGVGQSSVTLYYIVRLTYPGDTDASRDQTCVTTITGTKPTIVHGDTIRIKAELVADIPTFSIYKNGATVPAWEGHDVTAGRVKSGYPGYISTTRGPVGEMQTFCLSDFAGGNYSPISGEYFTEFAATENPISEGGRWASPPQPAGIKWTYMRSDASISGGIAYGTNGALNLYDDSYAKYVGMDFPSPTSIEITAIIYRSPSLPAGSDYPEKELWFCIDDGTVGNDAYLRGYEVMVNPRGFSNMGKWLGGQNAGDIPVMDNGGAFGELEDGDELRATITRSGSTNTISVYHSRGGTLLSSYSNTDTTFGGVASYTVGRPGLGAFNRPSQPAHNLCGFKSVKIRAI